MNPDIVQFEIFAKDMLRRCMAEEDPEAVRTWAVDTLARMGGSQDKTAVMTWLESFDLSDQMIKDYEARAAMPDKEKRILSWPWQSWRNIVDPLEEGMLGLITAPDGQGKTIYGESIAEYWAAHKNKVVFVHYELNRKLMMLRRMSRHASVLVRTIKDGKLSPEEKNRIAAFRKVGEAWDGYITYLHTPGWSMEQTNAELFRLVTEGQCDAVVLDYVEKASTSVRQLKMFGTNTNQREADNVEILKNFSEKTGVPVLMIAQMSKEGKTTSFKDVDRNGIRGAGEKSDKSNLVVMIKREKTDTGYSATAQVSVDKNTMGATGSFVQIMQPEYFRVGDPEGRQP